MKKSGPDILNKLKTYSAMTAAVLAAHAASSQIVYTDIDPDFELDEGGDLFLLDLNNDGADDFIIYMATNTNPGVLVAISPLGSVGSIGGSTGSAGVYAYPFAFEAGEIISDGLVSWNGYGSNLQTLASISYYFVGPYGNWFDIADGFLGLRVENGPDNNYGWSRMDASADGFTFTIKDYAYNSVVNEQICAGDSVGAPDCLNENIAPAFASVSDDADNGNGLDLNFTFDQSLTEAGISEYRVIAVKSSDAAAFAANISVAEGLGGAQYISVTPSGAGDYSGTFTASSQDSEGDLIANDVPYKLFILGIAQGGLENVLSDPSQEITLDIDIAIQNFENVLDVPVYPNPASDELIVEISDIISKNIKVEVSDATGKKVQDVKYSAGNVLTIDIRSLAPGVYFLTLSGDMTNSISRFVKE